MQLQTAKGVRDLPPTEKALKNQVVTTLTSVFELYGFQPLETPILERYETLSAKFAAGEESDALKETFKLKDQGDRELGLRFDLTVPLCRFVAMNPNLKLPFKRYEIGVVFRDGPIKAGRARQFWQCDFDIIGTASMLADAEILAVLETGFKQLGLDVIIKVNNRKLLTGILEQAGIRDKEAALVSLDKLEKFGRDAVEKELQGKKYSPKQIKEILNLINPQTTFSSLKKAVKEEIGIAGIKELEELFEYTEKMGLKKIQFDASLARGLAYYTGTVFEAYLKNGKITSSLAGGGRYDDMIGKFRGGNSLVPALGASFGLEPIMDALKLENKIPPKPSVVVYVLPLGTEKECLELVQELRRNNIPAGMALGKKGVSKNLEYASALGIPYVAIIGEDELKKKKVLLRNMNSGTEQLLLTKEIIKKLKPT